MAGETQITLVGNLTGDPDLRFTPSGAAVANFTVASTPRTFDRQTGEWRDGEVLSPVALQPGQKGQRDGLQRLASSHRRGSGCVQRIVYGAERAEPGAIPGRQIGRASCRERV